MEPDEAANYVRRAWRAAILLAAASLETMLAQELSQLSLAGGALLAAIDLLALRPRFLFHMNQ